MARETSYFVQAFAAGRGGNLKAGAPIACKTATGALRTAERLALSKLGVIAFSSTAIPIGRLLRQRRSFPPGELPRPSIEQFRNRRDWAAFGTNISDIFGLDRRIASATLP